MSMSMRIARAGAVLLLSSVGACSSLGGLGNVLGGVLGGQNNQVSGYVQGVDTRSQQLYLQQSNGQSVTLQYDANTQVVYNNQRYNVTSLERGDQVTARVQQANNGAYYTDLVQVDQSVSASSPVNSSGGNVQTLQGTVRAVDMNSGLFVADLQNGDRVTVQLGSQVSRSDYDRFRGLRVGDYARFYGVYISNGRVELRQFY